jgi:hypothetical protein
VGHARRRHDAGVTSACQGSVAGAKEKRREISGRAACVCGEPQNYLREPGAGRGSTIRTPLGRTSIEHPYRESSPMSFTTASAI